MELSFQTILLTFLAGVLTFLAPCTLPLVPGYLAFISGSSLEELTHADAARKKELQARIFLNALLFVAGFSLVVIILGIAAAFVGAQLAAYKSILTRIGGVLVILFSFVLLGFFRVPLALLQKETRLAWSSFGWWKKIGAPLKSFLLGIAFAAGWTPCTGPILATVLVLSSTRGTVAEGALMLTIFACGLAIPFLAVSATLAKSIDHIKQLGRFGPAISKIGGVLLFVIGCFMITDKMGYFISLTFSHLRFLGYEKILNYL